MKKVTKSVNSIGVSRSLYGALFHYCQYFDKVPAAKALLARNVDNEIHPVTCAKALQTKYMSQILGKKDFYTPEDSDLSLVKILRTSFREKSQQVKLPRHVNPVTVSLDDRLDSGFAALRYLSGVAAEAREFELPQLFACEQSNEKNTEITIANALEKGVFLISHPLLNGSFSRSVILLVEHSRSGAVGYIVNKPSKDSVPSSFNISKSASDVSSDDLKQCFQSNMVRIGGPVSSVQVIHRHPSLGGATLSYNDSVVHVGVDLARAIDKVMQGDAQEEDFVFFSGSSSWTGGQLEREISLGTWIVARAPVDMAFLDNEDLWQDMLQKLGGEYAHFAHIPTSAVHSYPEEDDS